MDKDTPQRKHRPLWPRDAPIVGRCLWRGERYWLADAGSNDLVVDDLGAVYLEARGYEYLEHFSPPTTLDAVTFAAELPHRNEVMNLRIALASVLATIGANPAQPDEARRAREAVIEILKRQF